MCDVCGDPTHHGRPGSTPELDEDEDDEGPDPPVGCVCDFPSRCDGSGFLDCRVPTCPCGCGCDEECYGCEACEGEPLEDDED